MDIKKFLKSPVFTHTSVAVVAFMLTLALGRGCSDENFTDKQYSSVYKTDSATGKRVLNRDYFNPKSFKQVDWANMSNAEIATLFGETAAKEMALDIDSINSRLTTPGKLFGLDYNYCNKSVTNAIVDATARMNFRKNKFQARPFAKSKNRSAALYNGDVLIEYFASDSIPGTVLKNPKAEDFKNISAGSVVRFPGHSKMFIGIGFVDETGMTFVPDASGRPVIASGYNERFSYFNNSNCVVIDIAKIVEHKLIKSGRTR